MTNVLPWGISPQVPYGQVSLAQNPTQSLSVEKTPGKNKAASKNVLPVEPTATGKAGEACEVDYQHNLINSFANRVFGIPQTQVNVTI